MEVRLKLNGENVVLNISDITVDGKPVTIENKEQVDEPKFKDGDFCYSTNGRIYYVFIFKSKINTDKSKYHAFMYLGWTVDASFKIDGQCVSKPETTRLASAKEKELLLRALKENSLRWDEEAKEILDLKWKPKHGEKYFSFDSYIQPTCFIWANTRNDEHCYLNNKCFKTLEEAEKYAKKIAEILKNREL